VSYIFDVGDETVWSPALRVGELFVGQLRLAAISVKQETGLKAVASDMYEIDIEEFELFVRKMFNEYSSSNNFIYRELLRGMLATSLVLLERAGVVIEPVTDDQRSFIGELDAYSRAMPT
jgi:Family of unknown function (DUF6086)